MDNEYIIMLLILIIIFWVWSSYEQKNGFVNNDIYFMSGDKNSVLEEPIIQPRLIHKINIPNSW